LLALIAPATPAFAWYQGALKHRDLILDAALVFAYYEKCDAGPIPAAVKERAEKSLNMAGPSTAAGARRDVKALITKLGVRSFCSEYQRDITAGENLVVTGRENRGDEAEVTPGPGQSANDWVKSCHANKESADYVSCHRYARGVADGLITAQMLDEIVAEDRNTPQTSVICIPKSIITNQLVEVGLRYWNGADAETRNESAPLMLADAWKNMWPCPHTRS
jgi:hypothetical protein